MQLADLKKRIQNHLSDDLVTIVGSGLSVAEGIPGMPALAQHLIAAVTPHIEVSSQGIWKTICDELSNGKDLESTLLDHPPDTHLETLIVDNTARFLGAAEESIFDKVFSGSQQLRFARLLPHLPRSATGLPVITTNYDRLIELAAELSGFGVDTLFAGHRAGRLDADKSRFAQCRGVVVRKVQGRKKQTLDFAPHIRVLKPHGSFDWYHSANGPIACAFPLNRQRMMITPGLNKYRGGYNPPFDTHREIANKEIDNAGRYLIIGYGFNDEHLQTHLEQRLSEGKPAILVTRTLSAKAAALIPKSPNLIGLSRTTTNGTLATTATGSFEYPETGIWDIATLVQEVLTP